MNLNFALLLFVLSSVANTICFDVKWFGDSKSRFNRNQILFFLSFFVLLYFKVEGVDLDSAPLYLVSLLFLGLFSNYVIVNFIVFIVIGQLEGNLILSTVVVLLVAIAFRAASALLSSKKTKESVTNVQARDQVD